MALRTAAFLALGS